MCEERGGRVDSAVQLGYCLRVKFSVNGVKERNVSWERVSDVGDGHTHLLVGVVT